MKSREEYLASIYSKRDALLKKRKKHIAQTVTAFSAVILLTVSVIAVSRLSEKPSVKEETTVPLSEQKTESPCTTREPVSYTFTDTDKNEPVKIQSGNFAESVTEKKETFTEKHTNFVTHSVEETIPETDANNIDSAASTDETKKNNIGSIFKGFIFETTEPLYSPDTGGDDSVVDEIEKPDSGEGFTQNEIITAAIKYLPDDAKEYADPEKAFSTVTRTAQGEEYYEVRFDINGIKYNIVLNAENLDMIAIESTDNSSAPSFEQPQAQISPPYIPQQ